MIDSTPTHPSLLLRIRDAGDRQSVAQRVEEIAADHHGFVRGRIENRSEFRTLVELPRDDAVEEIGHGRSGEDEERDPVLAAERRVDEDGNGEETQQGERVWNRQHQRAQVTRTRIRAPTLKGEAGSVAKRRKHRQECLCHTDSAELGTCCCVAQTLLSVLFWAMLSA